MMDPNAQPVKHKGSNSLSIYAEQNRDFPHPGTLSPLKTGHAFAGPLFVSVFPGPCPGTPLLLTGCVNERHQAFDLPPGRRPGVLRPAFVSESSRQSVVYPTVEPPPATASQSRTGIPARTKPHPSSPKWDCLCRTVRGRGAGGSGQSFGPGCRCRRGLRLRCAGPGERPPGCRQLRTLPGRRKGRSKGVEVLMTTCTD